MGQELCPFPDTPFPDWPWDLVFSPDGSMLAMSGQNTPAVVVWDTSSGEIIATPTVSHEIDPEWVMNAAFSPDGDRLVASLGSELWMFSTDDWSEVSQYLAPGDGRGSSRQSDLHPGWRDSDRHPFQPFRSRGTSCSWTGPRWSTSIR